MKSRSRQVGLAQAGVGTVLAADVFDGQGGLLLPKGTALTGPLLRALERRGVERLRVLDQPVTPGLLATELARASERLAHLFRRPGPGSADALLREALARYRMDALE